MYKSILHFLSFLSVLTISGMPLAFVQLGAWLNMIDEFYDRNVKVIISAKVSIDNLCNIKKINSDFKRTKSRLNEMQSTEYMKKEHIQ